MTRKPKPDWPSIADEAGVTAAQAKKIVRLYRDDELALAPVGEAVKLPVSRVRAVLEAAGVELRPKTDLVDWSLAEWGRPFSEVAERLSEALGRTVTRQAVQAHAKRTGITPPARSARAVVIETPAADAPLREIVGWRISLHQARHQWTNDQVAGGMGGSWTSSSIGVIKRGETGPGRRTLTPKTLQQIAGVLLVSPADLLLLPGQTALAEQPQERAAPDGDWRGDPKMADAWRRIIDEWGALTSPSLDVVFGLNIARWRLSRGLSQAELARAVSGNEHHERISAVEHGKPISLEALELFAEALKTTPADLARLPLQPALVPVPEKSG
jgi:transcriptional regulator with XRE-family HTH domain